MAHEQIEYEKQFNRWLSRRLRNMRKEFGLKQKDIKNASGYSLPQIGRFEDENDGVPIPAFILMVYTVMCDLSVARTLDIWSKSAGRELKANVDQEKKLFKQPTDKEKDLLVYLRNNIRRVADISAVEFLLSLKKTDLEALYCLKRIKDDHPDLDATIRKEIYLLYKYYGSDNEKTVRLITKNLRQLPGRRMENEYLY